MSRVFNFAIKNLATTEIREIRLKFLLKRFRDLCTDYVFSSKKLDLNKY